MLSPYLLDPLHGEQLDAARQAGDRVAWLDAWTSRFDATAYMTASLGVPDVCLDGTTGRWSVPEEVCWGCWQRIEPPVVRLAVNADSRHYHPRCLPEADFGTVHTGWHLRSCDRLPFYAA